MINILCAILKARASLSQDDMTYEAYRFMAAAPESSSDHSGEDVAVYAVGPQSHLFRGLYQQNYIPHVLAYAACIGEGAKFCDSEHWTLVITFTLIEYNKANHAEI